MANLTDFMVSRVRAKLIKIFLSRPTEMYYVRELTRAAKEEINAVRRELARMEERGMVKTRSAVIASTTSSGTPTPFTGRFSKSSPKLLLLEKP